MESELSDMGSVDDWNARLVGTTEEMKLCWKTGDQWFTDAKALITCLRRMRRRSKVKETV